MTLAHAYAGEHFKAGFIGFKSCLFFMPRREKQTRGQLCSEV